MEERDFICKWKWNLYTHNEKRHYEAHHIIETQVFKEQKQCEEQNGDQKSRNADVIVLPEYFPYRIAVIGQFESAVECPIR